jgi:hypothetical protein
VDGADVTLEMFGSLKDLTTVIKTAGENLAARVVGIAGNATTS